MKTSEKEKKDDRRRELVDKTEVCEGVGVKAWIERDRY
jgi:hypothetical protein